MYEETPLFRFPLYAVYLSAQVDNALVLIIRRHTH